MEKPSQDYLQAAKRILQYIEGTLSDGIVYSYGQGDHIGFTDSDWADIVEDHKSTSIFVFHIGSTTVSWSSMIQPLVALSTMEAEYMAATLHVHVKLFGCVMYLKTCISSSYYLQ